MANTETGQADHRAVEVVERCARIARHNGVPMGPGLERLILAAVLQEAMPRWFERRGYTMRHDATPQPGDGSPGNLPT